MHVTTDFPAILPNLHCVLLTHHFLFPVTKVNKEGRGKCFNNCDGVCSLLESFLTPFYTPSWREAQCEDLKHLTLRAEARKELFYEDSTLPMHLFQRGVVQVQIINLLSP